jgi:hypothetical protein|tara:strand:- start:185 stop:616 length:432 start_codon:yes stop_codon:yes gene_type:complete
MRVKLQYSVELEEVPDVAADLIQDEADRLSYCDHAIQSIVESLKQEEPHITFVIDKIDKIRQSLGIIDLRLSEMENLISGYAQAINPPQSNVVPQPTPQPPAPNYSPPSSGKVDPETGVYNYERPYGLPDDPAEDLQVDGEQE